MTAEGIKKLIEQGEGIEVEFKESYTALPTTIYETICAFHNRKGGHILLGISKDEKTVIGVKESTIKNQLSNLANALNNPQTLNPTTYLSPEVIEVDGKSVIYIYVPEGSQAYSHKGNYFNRNEDGDYKLANKQLIAELYTRKQSSYTENRVYTWLKMEHFDEELFDYVRQRVAIRNKEHIWLNMSNEEILNSAKLRLIDPQSGEEGYTLAAVLLFGKENVIASLLPHYKTDAICRKDNVELYDDRDIVTCNLITAHTRLNNFIIKHLPEKPFIAPDGQRQSYREKIFRELIPNLLMHREFSNAAPATLTIYKTTVVTENANIPNNWGVISLENYKPHPKNPTIARVFREVGLAEELGYGVRNLFKYCPLLVDGAKPVIEEGDLFKVTIQYDEVESNQASNQVSNQVSNQADDGGMRFTVSSTAILEGLEALGLKRETTLSDSLLEKLGIYKEELPEVSQQILRFLFNRGRASKKEIFAEIGYSAQKKNVEKYLNPLIEKNMVIPTIKDAPTSPLQKYVITNAGRGMISIIDK